MSESRAGSVAARGKWRTRLLDKVGRWLVHPRLPIHLAILALLLMLPALWVGLQLDDYTHRALMLDRQTVVHPKPHTFLDAFSFFDGDPTTNESLRDLGVLPWWSSSGIRQSFFRPLSALSMWIDYRLWPGNPPLMHLHSMFWYAALIVAISMLYRRLLGVTVTAGLAALLYAMDATHAIPVSWLANRNAVIAVFFGVLCLLFHDRWRRGGEGWHGAISAACLALALLAGEMGVATGAYLFSYALFLDRERWPTRLASLWPHALVFVVWAITYRAFDFGAREMVFYTDPASNPLGFAGTLATRATMLLLSQWSTIWVDFVGIVITARTAFTSAAILFAAFAFALFPLVRRDELSRFFLVGMLLSLAPVAGSIPSVRLLLFAGLGAMGLTARFLVLLRRRDGILPSSRAWRVAATVVGAYIVMVRVVAAPLSMPDSAYAMKTIGEPFTNAARLIPDDPALAHQDLILVNPHNPHSPALIWLVREFEGRPLPARIRQLSEGAMDMELHRVDDHTLLVRLSRGLFSSPLGDMYRSPEESPFAINKEFKVSGMTVRVTKTGVNGPEEMLYRFRVPLEHPSLRWLRWDGAYVPFTPPTVGRPAFVSGFDMGTLF